jgi:putative Mg2+ transporter-C (MgtC) family protein
MLEMELFLGWPETSYLWRVALRLVIAAVLGGLIGWQRERIGKPAGIRTHMLVALGACLFTLVPLEAGMHTADFSRVIQGLVTGIGFLGGGAVLKLSEEHQVRGLTTAAGIWATAAVGMAVGSGWLWPALCATVLAWIILALLFPLETWVHRRDPSTPTEPRTPGTERTGEPRS